jgi:hypothetical protein
MQEAITVLPIAAGGPVVLSMQRTTGRRPGSRLIRTQYEHTEDRPLPISKRATHLTSGQHPRTIGTYRPSGCYCIAVERSTR